MVGCLVGIYGPVTYFRAHKCTLSQEETVMSLSPKPASKPIVPGKAVIPASDIQAGETSTPNAPPKPAADTHTVDVRQVS